MLLSKVTSNRYNKALHPKVDMRIANKFQTLFKGLQARTIDRKKKRNSESIKDLKNMRFQPCLCSLCRAGKVI